jgi:hypothetical protein
MTRRSGVSALLLTALAGALVVPGSRAPATPVAETEPSPSPRRRQLSRGPKPYEAKGGNARVDIAKREQADAKRARKAAQRLAGKVS